jgi:glyoxylase-like metal-dependent hydrolase (beta-lactamase superfamily II)
MGCAVYRETFMKSLPLLCVLSLLVFASSSTAAPQTQVPGYFRYSLGDFTVTALYDGNLDIPLSGYKGASLEKMKALAAGQFIDRPRGVPTAVNAYLVDTGSHRILVDTGTAKCFGPGLGLVPGNLRAAGYAPEDIDIVVITHLHGDHYCGLKNADGTRAYPKAAVWVAEEEAAYWLDSDLAAMPEKARSPFKTAREVMGLYQTAGAFHSFKAGSGIVDGMRSFSIPGHTPGQTAFLFESKGQSLLAMGDIVHCYAVQFPLPEVTIASDTDPATAAATRRALFASLAKDGTAVAGSHLPFPGIGHLRKDGEGYLWVPAEYEVTAK